MSVESVVNTGAIREYQENRKYEHIKEDHKIATKFRKQMSRAISETQKNKNTGIDIATKEAAIEFESMFHSLFMNEVINSSEREYEGGLAEEVFSHDLNYELIRNANKEEMGQIAELVYEDLMRQANRGEINIKKSVKQDEE